MFVLEPVLILSPGILAAFAASVSSPGAFGQAAAKPVIAVAPVGGAPGEAVQRLFPILRETFHCEAVAAPRIPLPGSAFDASRGQHLSTAILQTLAAAKRPDWERLLGVADVDLYVPDLNFVFGEADARRGVAVFSLARLGDADERLAARRAATEAIHELGHTYGLGHCSRSDCVMWFSNTLAESDRKGVRFCPEHEKELARNRPLPAGS
jgi:archaemetzincin